MAEKIDMSLDEIIKTNRKSQPQRRTAAGGNTNSNRPNAQRQNRQSNGVPRNGTGPVKTGSLNRQTRRQT